MSRASCDFCGGDLTGAECIGSACNHSRYTAEADLDVYLETPDMEEKMAILFHENNGDSPGAKWWLEMERPILFRQFWQTRYREVNE